MINRKKFAGIALMAISGFTLSVNTVLSTASATPEDTSVPVSTQVVTEELCTWYLLGAPSAIDLAPAVPGTKYEGELIEVSASYTEANGEELNVYSSGNVSESDRESHATCTFYNSVTRPIVTMSIADGEFTSSAMVGVTPTVDVPMDFSASTGNEFEVDQDSTCAIWTATDLTLKTGNLTGVVMTIPTLAVVDDRVTVTNDRCKADLVIKIKIPAGKTPAYPGRTYTWSGPGFTTALTTPNTDPIP